MPKLFGLDIAKIVNASIAAAGNVRPGVLHHSGPPYIRDPDNLTAGLVPTESTHDVRGFAETSEVRRPDQVGTLVRSVLYILGESVNPKIVPVVNDKVVMDGTTYSLVELLELDPASALYKFRAET